MKSRTWPEIMKKGFVVDKSRRDQLVEGFLSEPDNLAREVAWAAYAERAVHVNEPDFRVYFAEMVAKELLSGRPLPLALREWLAYVLGRLLADNAIPHEGKGRAKKSMSVQAMESSDLIAALATIAHEPIGIVACLERAAERLNWSYEKTRELFYKPAFRDSLKTIADGEHVFSKNIALIIQKDSTD